MGFVCQFSSLHEPPQPPSVEAQPPSIEAQQSSVEAQPPLVEAQPTSVEVKPGQQLTAVGHICCAEVFSAQIIRLRISIEKVNATLKHAIQQLESTENQYTYTLKDWPLMRNKHLSYFVFCVICKTRKSEYMYAQCTHIGICANCNSNEITHTCPICRATTVTERIHLN